MRRVQKGGVGKSKMAAVRHFAKKRVVAHCVRTVQATAVLLCTVVETFWPNILVKKVLNIIQIGRSRPFVKNVSSRTRCSQIISLAKQCIKKSSKSFNFCIREGVWDADRLFFNCNYIIFIMRLQTIQEQRNCFLRPQKLILMDRHYRKSERLFKRNRVIGSTFGRSPGVVDIC
jgi:hypothetical protein